jgi:hypothetical protein
METVRTGQGRARARGRGDAQLPARPALRSRRLPLHRRPGSHAVVVERGVLRRSHQHLAPGGRCDARRAQGTDGGGVCRQHHLLVCRWLQRNERRRHEPEGSAAAHLSDACEQRQWDRPRRHGRDSQQHLMEYNDIHTPPPLNTHSCPAISCAATILRMSADAQRRFAGWSR